MTTTCKRGEETSPLDAEAIQKLGDDIPPVLMLIKFTDSKYVESIRNGHLRMSRQAFFQQIEIGAPIGQRDKDEGLFAYHQPDRIRISINGHDVGRIFSPLQLRQITPPSFLFCATAVTRNALIDGGGRYEVPVDMRAFGDTAVVIHDFEEFKRRVAKALSKKAHASIRAFPGSDAATGLVQYVPRTYHGDMGPFRKFDEYAYQSEWRIALIDVASDDGRQFFSLEIGDISDITAVVKSEDLFSVGLSEVRPPEG